MAADGAAAMNASTLVVTGTATLNIIPDRITAEIGLEEYYRPKKTGCRDGQHASDHPPP